MKLFLSVGLLCFAMGCGKHDQSLYRKGSSQPLSEIGETDKALILINAVNQGDLGVIDQAFQEGADLNIRNNEGLTLIMVAIKAEQFAVIEYLVEHDVDLDLPTESEEFDPSLTARQFVERKVDLSLQDVFLRLLNKEPFEIEELESNLFKAITLKNANLAQWLLDKGLDPNTLRLTSNGAPKDTALIYLFSLKGVKNSELSRELDQLKQVFEAFISHPKIDINLKIIGSKPSRNKSPLKNALKRLEENEEYQSMVDRLIELGATE